jgi:hypothetical protein
MRCRATTTAILAVLLLASSICAEEPIDGITGLQILPSTAKGQLFGACFNEMLSSYGTSDKILYDVRINKTFAPIEVRLDGQFAEQVSLLAAGRTGAAG